MTGIDLRTDGAAAPDPSKPAEADKSLGELLSQLSHDFSDLVSTQVALAKTEIKDEVARAGKGVGVLGGAAFAAYLAILLLSFAAAWGLAAVMPTGWAFVIVGAVWLVVAAVLFAVSRDRLRTVQPIPPQTRQSLKEDIEWARQQTS
jgi:uncharacterized membrane protein YqjE